MKNQKQTTLTEARSKAINWLTKELRPLHFADSGGSNCPGYRRFYALRAKILKGEGLGIAGIVSVMEFLGHETFFKKK